MVNQEEKQKEVLLASAIYQGTVRHRRYQPKLHEFSYHVFMVYLDLREVDQVVEQSRWWSSTRFNLAWFRRRDFLDGKESVSLYDGVADLVEERTGIRPAGPIRMLTNLRYFGFIINPITCYYCFDVTGQRLETIVAEVTNTPWQQRCHYVLKVADQKHQKQKITFDKAMHVSPFQPMDLQYRWQGTSPGDNLVVHIDVLRHDEAAFDATMTLKYQEMTSRSMNRVLWRYPWMTLKVFLGIYWQAVKLAVKRIPYHNNPKSPSASNNSSLPSGAKL